MLKKILIALGLVIIALIGFTFYLINPNDAQYKSFYDEAKALEALKKDDMDSYVKFMSNPVTLKYHAPIGLYVTLITLGRYDEAEKAVKSYITYKDYTACTLMDYHERFMCRILNMLYPTQGPDVDMNKWLSIIYFEKGDFEKAFEYNKRAKKQSVCYNVKLYSALGDIPEATKNLNDCEFLIPIVLNELLEEKKVKVNVLETNATWYGVTYKEDKEMVVNAINKLIEEGQYNKNLWE